MLAHSKRWSSALASPAGRFYALAGFLTLVALIGGGSRDDIQSLVILRPLALLACAVAVLQMRAEHFRRIRAPLLLLLGFFAVHLLHLLPLPAVVWETLPRRDLIATLDELLGQPDRWRPLTFSPAKTANSLFALFVPLAALLLFSLVEPADRRRILYWLVGFALVSAIVGIAQLLGPADGVLYFYDITNEGRPVGLFSNRNHQSFLLASAIGVCFWLAAYPAKAGRSLSGAAALAAALVLMFLPLVFVTGSRAGLLLAAVAIAGGIAMVLRSPVAAKGIRVGRGREVRGSVLALGFAVILLAVVLLVVLSARDVALARMFAEDSLAGTRGLLLPLLLQMLGDFWLLGVGMGAFEFVYPIYEPAQIVSPRYLNEAHNDWLQIVIEGGMPVALLLLAFLAWLARRGGALVLRSKVLDSPAIPALLVVILLGIGSIFDYPLRVPSQAAIFAVMLGLMGSEPTRGHSAPAKVHNG